MSGPSITRMREAHIPQIQEIEKVSFGMPWSGDAFLNAIDNPAAIAYVVELGGEVAGYICALKAGDESEILRLAVAERFRRRGIARSLNTRCVAELRNRGCKSIYLEVRKSNQAAIKLYESFGFMPNRVRRAYYSSPSEDALVMKLAL